MLPTIVRRRTNSLPNLVDEFFNDGFLPFFSDSTSWPKHLNTPAVNVEENDKEFKIDMAIPGIEKEAVKVSVNDGVLNVSYENKTENEEKNDRVLRREFSYTSFSRSFTLPDEVDVEKIKASHKNGILEIRVPKAESKVSPSREIKIS